MKIVRLNFFVLVLVFFVYLFAGSYIHSKNIQVAVLKLQNASGDKEESEFLSEQFAAIIESRLRREQKIQLQERRNLGDILKEIELSQYGIFDESKEIEIGRLLRADFLISGQYKINSDNTSLIFRVIHLETGKVGFVGQLSGEGIELLKKLEAVSGMAAADILGERSSHLTINTSPAESKVYVDGNYIGEAPIVKYPLTSGEHEIRVESDYYVPEEKQIILNEGNTKEEFISLHFKPYQLYKFRVHFDMNFYGMSTKLSKAHLPLNDGAGIEVGFDYFYNRYIFGLFLSTLNFSRENSIHVFNNEYIEKRDYIDNLFSFKFGYHILIHPKILAVIPGISLGYRSITDDLEGSENSKSPYMIETDMAQIGVHLDFDLLPGSRFSLHARINYLISEPFYSYNGNFNSLGVKTFDKVKIESSQLYFQVGLNLFFNSKINLNKKPKNLIKEPKTEEIN
ncbi:MAG: PEGA domain-containing protein [Spirochaetia bacterium]|nr:PEGA domain-containing protein [Spirochaetia bacterium]